METSSLLWPPREIIIDVSTRHLVQISKLAHASDPLGPLGSSSSQHRRTLELIMQEGSAYIALPAPTVRTVSGRARLGRVHKSFM